jgi:uncharacterized protein YbbC (DUF1343 family)
VRRADQVSPSVGSARASLRAAGTLVVCVSLAGTLLASAPAGAARPVVQVGLERVAADGGAPLEGKRVGLVVHRASVTADGRHALDVLRGAGVNVVRLFTPEHGLRGEAAAGETVAGGLDAASGLPIVSLYGRKTRPAASDMAGLDALVFDLQDGGVRFYTYVSTLLLCLDAAADSGVELVVLDRPDPLGGDLVEGPLSDPPELVPRSLVNMAPGPLVYGLTAGEMARFANARRARPARLTVVPMRGWRRSMTWSATGRPWPDPSPNLRSADAALAYPGVCLLEATNVSEGRGSEAPFLLLGAPWLRREALRGSVRVPGFALDAATFTPQRSAAAERPKYSGVACLGLRVRVVDARRAAPYELGVALLHALRSSSPEFAWRGDGSGLDRLVGTRRLRQALERGDSIEAILHADAKGIAAFERERRAALLYD